MQSDGTDVPSWMMFSPLNRNVYGFANVSTSKTYTIKILATDPFKASASTTFTLNILANKAPLVLNEIGHITSQMFMYFEYQIPESIFRDEDGDTLSYSMTPYDSTMTTPTWLKFIKGNRTLNGMPKDAEGSTLMFKVYADDGRGGLSYQVLYLDVNENYNLAKLVPLIIFGLLPLAAIFAFSFSMAFVRVPSIEEDKIIELART